MNNASFNPVLYSPAPLEMKQYSAYIDHLLQLDSVSEPLKKGGYSNINQQEDEDGEIKETWTKPL